MRMPIFLCNKRKNTHVILCISSKEHNVASVAAQKIFCHKRREVQSEVTLLLFPFPPMPVKKKATKKKATKKKATKKKATKKKATKKKATKKRR